MNNRERDRVEVAMRAMVEIMEKIRSRSRTEPVSETGDEPDPHKRRDLQLD